MNWENQAGPPAGTAFFGDTASPFNNVKVDGTTTVGSWTFKAGDPARGYAFNIVPTAQLDFTGTGITVNGGVAVIVNEGLLNFRNTSTAGGAEITNGFNGTTQFLDISTAGSATITNAGILEFNNSSTAGSAAITNGATAITDFSFSSGPHGDHNLSAGSLAGGGTFFLGRNELTVGSNNLSTAVTGLIADGGGGGGTGGSLTKTGTGTLTLSGVNTYTGGTTISGGTLAISADNNLGANTGGLTFNGGTLQFGASFDLANTRAITLNAGGGTFDTNGFNTTVSQAIAGPGTGSLTKTGTGTLTLSGVNTYTGGTMVSGGTLRAGAVDTFSSLSAHTVAAGAVLDLNGFDQTIASLASGSSSSTVNLGTATLTTGGDNTSTTFAGSITGAPGFNDALVKNGTGTFTLSGTNTYSGFTIVNAGTLRAGAANSFSSNSVAITLFGTATLDLNNFDQTVAIITGSNSSTVSLGSATLTIGSNTTVGGFGGNITGTGGITKVGSQPWTMAGTGNTYSGATTVAAGWLLAGATNAFSPNSAFIVNSGALVIMGGFDQTIGSLAGSGAFRIDEEVLTAGGDNTSTVFSGAMRGTTAATFNKAGSGTMIVSGNNSAFFGAVNVTDGTLAVNGSIVSSRMTTVNSDAKLTGTGTVGNTTIASGGIFAPGSDAPNSSMNISGSLVLQSGAQYLVQLNRSTASFANVSGRAELGGATVNAFFARDAYVEKQYRIVTASGGVTGSFDSVVESNLPPGFHTSLSTDDDNAYLNLALNFMPPPNGGLTGNQQPVADAIVGFFNTNGGIPMAFGGLTPAGLTQVSGETATGTQQTTFDAMTQFMGVMTDPFVAGRGEGGSVSGGATGYANQQAFGYAPKRQPNDALAAIYRKASPMSAPFAQRWSVWAAGYGGSQTTDGNAGVGSNTATSRIFGTAVGADYRFSPYTLAGFALAGGGTNFSIANGLGSGRSDLFQAGAFIRHTVGPAYISAALAYGWQDITTDRTVTVASIDQLRAKFNANAFSGRFEGGYRFVVPDMGITPYAAAQFTTFDLPAYAEQALSGSNTFALNYGAKSVTASRSELGVRTDRSWEMTDAIFSLRGRLAWAHDFNPDRNIAATFQTLPGASFVVNGAALASDAALTTASAEMKWLNGFSLAATFEGEFSGVTESYAGKGVVRYAW